MPARRGSSTPPSKRVIGRSSTPPPEKRAKPDPYSYIEENLKIVKVYLHDKRHCSVPGPASCREMLSLALPAAIGVGAPKLERTQDQAKLADFVGEVLEDSVKLWEEKAQEEKEEIERALGDERAAVEKLVAAKQHLDETNAKLHDYKTAVKAHTKAEKEAVQKLSQTENVVTTWDETQERKLERATLICNTYLEDVKEGHWANAAEHKQRAGMVVKLVQTLDVDVSLSDALPSALSKKPINRGRFDNQVVTYCDKVLKGYLAKLTDWANNPQARQAAKEEASKAAAEAQEALNAVRQAKQDSTDHVQSVEIELKEAINGHRDAQQTVSKIRAASKASTAQLGFQKASAARRSLHILTGVPDPEPSWEPTFSEPVPANPSEGSPSEGPLGFRPALRKVVTGDQNKLIRHHAAEKVGGAMAIGSYSTGAL